MIMSEIIYIVSICFLSVLCLFLSYKLYVFSMIILNIESAIEDCLEVLDDKYQKMNKIIQTPVFFDSIEVRQVISEIKDCQDAVIVVANNLTQKPGINSENTQEKV